MTITIDKNLCIACGRCVRVCPSSLFSIADGEVSVSSTGCIACGHCLAVCPRGAITHSCYTPSMVRHIDRSIYPSARSLMELIKGRRSNRQFTNQPIPPDTLSQIVDAGRHAPTATNSRDVKMLSVTDPVTIASVAQFTIDTFSSLVSLLGNPVISPLVRLFSPDNYSYIAEFRRMKEDHLAGRDPILHHPTALVIYYTDASSRFGCQDANLAYQNSSLMAEALGVAHFYTGFVTVAASMRRYRLQRILGISGTIHAGMSLGMPAFTFDNYIDRK